MRTTPNRNGPHSGPYKLQAQTGISLPPSRWWHAPAALLVLALSAALLPGCSRNYYSNQADQDAYRLVREKSFDPRWPLPDYTIAVDPRSRMYHPYSNDLPPMPPDDPTSHELMHFIDGKRGYPRWHDNGDTPFVENPTWMAYLPLNERGELVLDRQAAVQTALLHASEYQEQLEELYLSALDVAFERFRFDVQFFGGSSVFFTAEGEDRPGGPSSLLEVNALRPGNRLRAERLTATGAEMVIGLANSLVWEFSGPDVQTTSTLLDFSIVQPLLRAGGRAVVLERLTIAERTLLANVRQMERYRRGFYTEIVAGRNAGPGPSRRGGFFGGAGLAGFTGVGGGGFGRVGGGGGGGAAGGGVAGGAGAAAAGGFLGLMQLALEIQNQAANVAGLRDSLAQLQSAYDAGRIDRFQVDLARQALYNAQSRLLTSQAQYQAELDNFKIDLGLPPDLEVRIDDPLLDRFQLIAPALTETQNDTEDLINGLRQALAAGEVVPIEPALESTDALVAAAARHLETVQRHFVRMLENAPARRESLRELGQRAEVLSGEVEQAPFDIAAFEQRVIVLQRDLESLQMRMLLSFEALAEFDPREAPNPAAAQSRLTDFLTQLSGQLLELSLLQARAQLDSIVLDPVDMTPELAIEIAREYRRDWMNARANLVDTWRLIEFNANALLSSLNITFSGDIGNEGNNPLDLRSSNGRLTTGVEFDAPLTRMDERNVYRQAMLEYQQARRQYYGFRDRIYQSLRDTLRTMRLNEVNLELRRAAVEVAISQVDLARLRLREPPRPGEEAQFGASTARDLVQALTDLLSVQNDFLSVWVNYEVQRMGLDFDLGTMQLDDQGMWIDPGSEIAAGVVIHPPHEQLPYEPPDAPLLVPEMLPPNIQLEAEPRPPVIEPLPDPAGP
ncbi:MAG: TolC family protein [Pirellulales bacterium]